jgi:hypothetical protein
MEFSINEEWRELYDAEEELRTALKENPPADPNDCGIHKCYTSTTSA